MSLVREKVLIIFDFWFFWVVLEVFFSLFYFIFATYVLYLIRTLGVVHQSQP